MKSLTIDQLKTQLGLTDENSDKLKTLLGEGENLVIQEKDEKLITDDGKMVPQHRVKELTDAKKDLSERIEELTKEVDKLKPLAAGNEELQKKITELTEGQTTLTTEFDAKQLKLKKTFALKESLLNEGVEDPEARDLLVGKFDLDKIELTEDGKVKDATELVKPLKENKAISNLFGKTQREGADIKTGIQPGANGLFTKEQMENMTPEEHIANMETVEKSMQNIAEQN